MTRNDGLYVILRLGAWVVPYLPLRVAYSLAAAAGACAYFLFSSPRKGVTANLSRVMGRPSDSRAVRRNAIRAFQNDARNWVDTLRIAKLRPEEIISAIEIDGWEHLAQSVAQGKGLVLVAMHLGNFDLVGQVMTARGYEVTIPVEIMRPERLFRFLVEMRTSQGTNIVPIDRAPREMLRALRSGQIVAITADRNLGGKGATVTFFGREATLPRGPVSLARHAGSPLVVACGVRTGTGRFHGFVTPAIAMQSTGNAQDDDEKNLQQVASTMEHFIGAFPDQWLVFAPIWDDGSNGNRTATIGQQKGAAV